MSTHIKVCVRVRPENEKERTANQQPVVCVVDEALLIFDPVYDQAVSYFHGKVAKDPTSRKPRDANFAFDRVFGPSATNIEVYEQTMKAVLRQLIEGFNCSVFAYGATGAGKTFSMLGSPHTPGVIFLTMMDLYNMKDSEKDERTIDISISYLEVYNENIKDLLCPGNNNLPIRDDGKNGIVIPGLSIREPKTAEELLQMLERGNKNRTQHPTDANAESSRSHAVFQVFVKVRDSSAALSQDVKVSKLSLIDLAGSEKANSTRNMGARFREGANINKSLLALGNVINALADTKRKGNKHIPFRNSKLTRILKDSLGDNCRTVMLAAVSPSRLSYDETYNTLNYADRAKKIKAVLRRNVVNINTHVQNYSRVVDDLHAEMASLKKKLQVQTVQLAEHASLSIRRSSLGAHCNFDIDQLQTDISHAYGERRQIRDNILHTEMMQKQMCFTMARKQQVLDMVSTMNHKAGQQTVGKLVRAINSANQRQQKLDTAKKIEHGCLMENTKRLKCLVEGGQTVDNPHAQTILALQMKAYHYELESMEWQKQNQHLLRIVNSLQSSQNNHESLIQMFLTFLDTSQNLLNKFGLKNDNLAGMYKSIRQNIVHEREVKFFDDQVDMTDDHEMEEFKSLTQLSVLSANEHSLNIIGKPILTQAEAADVTIVLDKLESTFTLPNTASSSADNTEAINDACAILEAESPQGIAGKVVDSPVASKRLRSPAASVPSPSIDCSDDVSQQESEDRVSQEGKGLDTNSGTPVTDDSKITSSDTDINTPETNNAPTPEALGFTHSGEVISSTPQFGGLRRSPRFHSDRRDIFKPVAEVLQLIRGTGCGELEEESPDCPPAKLRILGVTPDSTPVQLSTPPPDLRRKLVKDRTNTPAHDEGRITPVDMDVSVATASPCDLKNANVAMKSLCTASKSFADAVKLPRSDNTSATINCSSKPNGDETFVLHSQSHTLAPPGGELPCLQNKENVMNETVVLSTGSCTDQSRTVAQSEDILPVVESCSDVVLTLSRQLTVKENII